MRRIVPVLCAFGLASAVPAAAQRPLGREFQVNLQTSGAQLAVAQPAGALRLLGGEFRANVETRGDQVGFAVAMSPKGDFVVAWLEAGASPLAPGLFVRRFAADGRPRGDAARVDTGRPASNPSLAVAPDGSFVVVWSAAREGGEPDSSDVQARLFGSDGSPLGGSIPVSAAAGTSFSPAVAWNEAGRFYVAWTTIFPNRSEALGRLYSSQGQPLTEEARLNDPAPGGNVVAAVASTAEGSFLVVWTNSVQVAPGFSVQQNFGRLVSRDGSLQVDATALTPTQGNWPTDIRLVRLSGGGFLLGWTEGGPTPGNYGFFARPLTAAGRPTGRRFRIAGPTEAIRVTTADMAADADNRIVMAWTTQAGAGGNDVVHARRFSAKGKAIGPSIRLSSVRPSTKFGPRLAGTGGGRFVAVWESLGQDGSDWEGFARRLESSGGAP